MTPTAPREEKKIMTNSKNTSRKSNPTFIWIATDSETSQSVCFSSVGTAFQYVQDSHDDMNPEGSVLMLDTVNGSVPATVKLAKAGRFDMSFSAGSADVAASVGGIQSKLEGAMAACLALGIDPSNVAKVGELRDELAIATVAAASTSALDKVGDHATFRLVCVQLHKRGYKRNNS